MPINSFLYPGAKVTLSYDVDNSLRFEPSDSAYLSMTPSSAGDRNTWTWSGWYKKGVESTSNTYNQVLFGTAGSDYDSIAIRTTPNDPKFLVNVASGSGLTAFERSTNALIRDPGAWYHFVVAFDSTQGTAANRVKVYINGSEITSFDDNTNGNQNANSHINNTDAHQIGKQAGLSRYLGGYLCEVCFIDGQALTPTSFGEFDEDSPTIWKPKDVSGLTFGTNGFYLEFKQSGTSQNSSGLGADTSGNDNHFASNNLAATDQSTDTCTNNFCTLNPLDRSTLSSDGTTFTEGNLKTTDASSNYLVATGTMAVTQGKWYFEVKIDATASHTASGVKIVDLDGWDRTDGSANGSYGWLYAANGDKRNGGSSSSYGDAFSANDIIGVAIDMDNKAVYFSRNGTFQASGDPTSGASKTNAAFTNLTGTITAQVYDGSSGQAHEFSMNFGSPPYSISSGNSDANGYGNFEYSVPSGYYSINSKNLAEFG